MLAQQLINAISLGGVYALFALGFTLVFGVLNVINLAQGAVFMLGAYAALYSVVALRLPLLAGIFLAMIVTGAAGWILDRWILAPLLATIGLAMVLTSAIEGTFGAENKRFPAELMPTEVLSLADVQITWLELRIILLAFALMALLLWGLKQTRLGRALRGLSESPKAAALLGVDVEGLFR